jgi:anti-anti-sigma regulatory factor
MDRRTISAHEFLTADVLPDDAELSGAELAVAFWQMKKNKRELEHQLLFWRSTNETMSDAYTKLSVFEERIRAQDETIRALTTPIIRVWERILVLPLVGALDGSRAAAMTSDLLGTVVAEASEWVILDLTGMRALDVDAAAYIADIRRAVGLCGARCLVSGLSAALAGALATRDADLGDLKCFATLHAALRSALTGASARPALTARKLR